MHGRMLVATLALAAVSTRTGAATLYVATTGADLNACLTPALPCLTIAHALALAQPGDGVEVAEGTYAENLVVTRDVSLSGGFAPGFLARGGPTVVDGGGAGSVIAVTGSTLGVLLSRLVLRNGLAPAGGGIDNAASLTVTECTIAANQAIGDGGGVRNLGALEVERSTLRDNVAGGSGGGVANRASLTLRNCTLSGNRAGTDGGGIAHQAGTTLLRACTVASNDAPAGAGGGVANADPSPFSLSMTASLIAGNAAAAGPDCSGSLRGGGLSLLRDPSGCALSGIPPVTGVDPLLGPLQDNGGPTATHALLPGSPAIDQLSVSPLPTDQRGYPRPVDGNGDSVALADFGAFEAMTWNLLRNDQVAALSPVAPPLATIFTGASAGCSPDPSLSLDAADPTDCTSRVPGEGSRTSTNGSDDADDLYVADVGLPGTTVPDPDAGLLGDATRPLVFWQVENAPDRSGLRAVKDLGRASVRLHFE